VEVCPHKPVMAESEVKYWWRVVQDRLGRAVRYGSKQALLR